MPAAPAREIGGWSDRFGWYPDDDRQPYTIIARGRSPQPSRGRELGHVCISLRTGRSSGLLT